MCPSKERNIMSCREQQRLWIFDFDGTISPLVSDRIEAKLDSSCKKLLADLSVAPSQYTAVLSSRAMDDLAPRLPIPNIFIGSASGLEWQLPGGKKVAAHAVLHNRLERKRKELLPKIKSIGSIPGVEIEDKNWSITVHIRKASVKTKKFIDMLMEDWTPVRHLRKFRGHEAIEVQLLSGIDKSYGVRRICDILHFTPAEGSIIYSGDDENDATAMQWVLHLKGIAITVGSPALVPGSRIVDNPRSLSREIRKLAGLGGTVSNQDAPAYRGRKDESL